MLKICQDVLLKKWIEVYDQSEKNYNPNKGIRIKTSILRSDLCDFSGAFIVVEGVVTLEADNDAKKKKIRILHLKTMHHLLIAFQILMA